MNATQHAKILSAYIGRISLADLRKILAAEEECWRAQAAYGTGSQMKAQDESRKVVAAAIEKALKDDLDNIETIIKRNV